MLASRSTTVRRRTYLFLASLAIFAAGCGGAGSISGGGGGVGEVSGVVFDTNGNVVRGADVFIQGLSVDSPSNSSGTYILHNVPAEDLIVRASITQDGVTYIGQNLARVFDNDRARSVNIMVVSQSQAAKIHGTVFDSHGSIVAGARVFAVGANNLSSNMALTDSNGNYTIARLAPGINYELNASTPDFQSDGTVVNLAAGDDVREDFTLTQASGVSLLSPPGNLSAIAWTSPDDSTRSLEASSAYEQIKRLYDPTRAQHMAATTRLTPSGDIVEVDLTWDRVFSDFLLGYGIYSALGSSGTLTQDDFLRDPLAQFYADTDSSLVENATYSFALTSVNTDRAEGNMSSRVVVNTLGPITALSPQMNPLRFRWNPVLNANGYVVFVFDRYPGVGVDSIWNNAGSPATGSSVQYGGPALNSGQTYYFIVLGLANSNTSRTISPVMSFTA